MDNASPRPWNEYGDNRIIDLEGQFVADVRLDDHTAELRQLIIRSANAAEGLAEALAKLMDVTAASSHEVATAFRRAHAALAKWEGKDG